MVGSAAAHRKLRKVFVRNELLKERQFGIGIGTGDLNPADIIGQIFTSATDENHHSSTSSSAVPSSSIIPNTSILPATSATLSSQVTSTFISSTTPVATVSSPTSTFQFISSTASQTTIPSTSASSASPTADSSSSSSTTSSGNIVGIVAAVIIAILALGVFGFFILRRRRTNRNAKLIHQVDPFKVGLPEKDLPPPPVPEQRMTFGTFYGRPGPGDDPFGKDQTNPSTAYIPSATYLNGNSASMNSPLYGAATVGDEKFARATSGRSLTSPFSDSTSSILSPIASPRIPSPAQSPFADPVDPSVMIQVPPAAGVKYTPSYVPIKDGSSGVPASVYSPVVRSSFGSPTVNTHKATGGKGSSGSVSGQAQTRPATMYNEEDVYAGI
ncbi:hypothetical protein GGU10DRAFT_44639 [Lentinula aff. detonsa]|uniref:Uncharacterized protein n=1 Tax=Lentinula aff. detonsa TaxID=2804958 RepID=A0AA38KYM0_9AGAR|nr:hypothetical protein GGU10DRAFT_44639 [Lentinula aff. detonsa]